MLASLYSNTEGDFSDFAIHNAGLTKGKELKNQLNRLKNVESALIKRFLTSIPSSKRKADLQISIN
jgi:hypothetical protein